jgi:hypothetical protein
MEKRGNPDGFVPFGKRAPLQASASAVEVKILD